MNASPFDIRRNRLAEAYLLLIRSAESNTASDDILADESDAATEATTQAARPAYVTRKRRAGQTSEVQHERQ